MNCKILNLTNNWNGSKEKFPNLEFSDKIETNFLTIIE